MINVEAHATCALLDRKHVTTRNTSDGHRLGLNRMKPRYLPGVAEAPTYRCRAFRSWVLLAYCMRILTSVENTLNMSEEAPSARSRESQSSCPLASRTTIFTGCRDSRA